MFECLVGYPPFCSENAHETYRKIMNWREQLYFPEDVHLSPDAEDLIRRYVVISFSQCRCFSDRCFQDHFY